MRTLIVVFILFGCSVVWGHDVNEQSQTGDIGGWHVSQPTIADLRKELEDLTMQMTSTFAMVVFEFDYEIVKLKDRIVELEKWQSINMKLLEKEGMVIEINPDLPVTNFPTNN